VSFRGSAFNPIQPCPAGISLLAPFGKVKLCGCCPACCTDPAKSRSRPSESESELRQHRHDSACVLPPSSLMSSATVLSRCRSACHSPHWHRSCVGSGPLPAPPRASASTPGSPPVCPSSLAGPLPVLQRTARCRRRSAVNPEHIPVCGAWRTADSDATGLARRRRGSRPRRVSVPESMARCRTRCGPRSIIYADDSGSEEERAAGGLGPGAADPERVRTRSAHSSGWRRYMDTCNGHPGSQQAES
jgi:hypothetical protein